MDLHILDKYLLEGKQKSPYAHIEHKVHKMSAQDEHKRAHRMIENQKI